MVTVTQAIERTIQWSPIGALGEYYSAQLSVPRWFSIATATRLYERYQVRRQKHKRPNDISLTQCIVCYHLPLSYSFIPSSIIKNTNKKHCLNWHNCCCRVYKTYFQAEEDKTDSIERE